MSNQLDTCNVRTMESMQNQPSSHKKDKSFSSIALLGFTSVLFILIYACFIVTFGIGVNLLAVVCLIILIAACVVLSFHFPFICILSSAPLYALRAPLLAISPDLSPITAPSDSLLRATLGIPDILVIVMFAVSFVVQFMSKKLRRRDVLLVVFGAFLLSVYFIASSAPVEARMAYLRSFLLPPTIFMAGYLSSVRDKYVYRKIVHISIGVSVIGILFYCIPVDFWVNNANIFLNYKYGGTTDFGIPGSWITSFLNTRILRLGGTFLDPIAFGYWLAVLFIISFVYLRKSIFTLVFGSLILLTFSKGAMLGAASAVLAARLYSSKRITSRLLYIGILAMVAVAASLLVHEGKGSFFVHMAGLVGGLGSALSTPLGNGLGAGGNWAGILGDDKTHTLLETGAESALGTIGYQLGMVGIVLFVLFLLWQIQVRFKSDDQLESALGFGLLVMATIGLIFQENSLSATASFLLWWTLGNTTSPANNRIAPRIFG